MILHLCAPPQCCGEQANYSAEVFSLAPNWISFVAREPHETGCPQAKPKAIRYALL